MKPFQHRKIIVDLRRQLAFGLETAVMGLVFWIIALLLFFNPLFSFSVENEESSSWVLDALVRIVMLKWPLLAIAFVLTWMIGIVMGKRLVGPILGVQRVLNAWKAGNYEARFQFRKFDYIAPLASSLNELLDEQAEVIMKARDLVQEIQNHSGDPKVLGKTRELLKLLYKQ